MSSGDEVTAVAYFVFLEESKRNSCGMSGGGEAIFRAVRNKRVTVGESDNACAAFTSSAENDTLFRRSGARLFTARSLSIETVIAGARGL